MKKTRRILIPLILMMIASVLLNSCMAVPSKDKGGSLGQQLDQLLPGFTGSPGSPGLPAASLEPPASSLPPQEALVAGAKTMLSTDYENLLTEQADGAFLLGLNSEFWNDVNSSSNGTSLTATVGNISIDGEESDEGLNLELELVHNADSGDSSIEAAIGLGSDTNLSGGLYVKDGVGIFKPSSTDQDIILYTLPEYSDTSLMGTFGAMFTGLLSEDGTATDVSESQSDREALAAEVLDPWLTSTSAEDYEETTESYSLLGEDVDCRVVRLYLGGQKAYDFALENITALDNNDLLSGANSVLGLGTFSSLSLDSLEEFDSDSLTSDDATAQIIDTLEAMTQDEIDGMNFWFSVVFNGDKAVGISCDIEAADTAMYLDLLACREGSENQLEFSFYKDDASFEIKLSRISTGGSTYEESIDISIYDDAGQEVLSGWYDGTADETEASLYRDGFLTLDLLLSISDDEVQTLTIDAYLTSSLSKTDTGYSGEGQADVSLYADENMMTMTALWTAAMEKSDAVTVNPPLYTDSNSVMVSDLESLSEAIGLDYSEVADQSNVVQLISILGSLITSGLGDSFAF